jgi:tetratricopeptide (TPR) repeat protein
MHDTNARVRRRRWTAAALALLLLGGIAAITWHWRRAPTSTAPRGESVPTARQVGDEQREAIVEWTQRIGQFPTEPEYRLKLAGAHQSLAFALTSAGRPQEAEQPLRDCIAVLQKARRDFPARPDLRNHLAKSHVNLVQLLTALGRPEKALAQAREALRLFEDLAAESPTVAEYHSNVGLACSDLGQLFATLHDFPAARQHLAEALVHHRAAFQRDPGNAEFRERLLLTWQAIVQLRLRLGQHAEAANGAAEVLGLSAGGKEDYYAAARAVALCATLAEQDTRLPPSERREVAQGYTDKAIALLHEAVSRGFRDSQRLKTDPKLGVLRSRPDFRKMVQELESK